MPHPLLEEPTFADKFKNLLNLSQEQTKSLDAWELEMAREFYFPLDPEYSDEKLFKRRQEGFCQRLTPVQREQYNAYRPKCYCGSDDHDQLSEFAYLDLSTEQREQLSHAHTELQAKLRHALKERGKWQNAAEQFNLFLHSILTPQQRKLKQAHDGRQRMQRHNARRYYDPYALIKSRFHYLQLSDSQAQQAQNSGLLVPVPTDAAGNFLSEWAMIERERALWNDILRPDQMQIVEEVLLTREQEHISSLIARNEHAKHDVAQERERLRFTWQERLPVLCARRQEIERVLSTHELAYIDDLRKRYQYALHQGLTRLLKSHQRSCRRFVPREFEKLCISQYILALEPSAYVLRPKRNWSTIKLHKVDWDEIHAENQRSDQKLLEPISERARDVLSAPHAPFNTLREKQLDFTIQNYEAHGGSYRWNTCVSRIDSGKNLTTWTISMLLLHAQVEDNVWHMKRLEAFAKSLQTG